MKTDLFLYKSILGVSDILLKQEQYFAFYHRMYNHFISLHVFHTNNLFAAKHGIDKDREVIFLFDDYE